MRILNLNSVIDALPPSAKAAASRVNLHLAEDDGMYQPDGDHHYLTCGASALNVILSAQQMAGIPAPSSLLDFGAGAGRVTRWLRAAFPHTAIAACDLRADDMAFCRTEFGAESWTSGIDIATLSAPSRYDLIWVGSVLTHLSAVQSGRLIDKLLSWTKPGGLLVMSTIGRTAAALRDEGDHAYIHQQGWDRITKDYADLGFGYADYAGEEGYGLSLIKLSWIGGLVEHMPDARLVVLAEKAWDNLHDIVALQKTDPTETDRHGGLTAEAAALNLIDVAGARMRNQAIEDSTIWRATRLVRSIARLFKR